MEKRTIALVGTELEYTIRRSARAKRTSLTIYPDGTLSVTLTPIALESTAERLIKHKQNWILNNLSHIAKKKHIFLPKVKKSEVEKYRKIARIVVHERIKNLNNFYNFPYKRVFIKNHRKQWGSCSAEKNLNFNLQLIHLPENLRDLVIVHELCHLKHLNHSKSFWKEVSRTMPSYKKLEKELKRYVIA